MKEETFEILVKISLSTNSRKIPFQNGSTDSGNDSINVHTFTQMWGGADYRLIWLIDVDSDRSTLQFVDRLVFADFDESDRYYVS